MPEKVAAKPCWECHSMFKRKTPNQRVCAVCVMLRLATVKVG